MYTPNFYVMCALPIIGIILFVIRVVYDLRYDSRDACDFGVAACIILPLLIALISYFPDSKKYKTELVENNTDTYMKIRYVQYHPFKENSLENVILAPQQAKLLNRVSNVSTNRVNFAIKD